jgi:hypothetical protein
MFPAAFGLAFDNTPLVFPNPFSPLQAFYFFGVINLASAEQALLICSTARIASSREA